MDPSDLNPYQTPEGLEEPESPAQRFLPLAEPIHAAGSMSLDEWEESEWLVRHPRDGVTTAARPRSKFAQYTGVAMCAYLLLVGGVIWRGMGYPVLTGFLAALGAIIFGTIGIYWTARWRLHRQWKRGKGPFQPVAFEFDAKSFAIVVGGERSELAWHEFDYYRRNNKVLLLHVRGAISSLIVARGMFSTPQAWQSLCAAIDRMFKDSR